MDVVVFSITSYVYCLFVKKRKLSPPNNDKPSICFGGCGVRYHLYGGVAEYALDNFDTRNIDIICVSGGIFAAVILSLGRKMTEWTNRDWPRCYEYWSKRSLFMWFDTTEFHRNMWRGYLPHDAYQICSDHLHITISRLGIYGFYEERISTYASNEELIDAILGTIHILGTFRNFPVVRGRYAFDGCYSNLKPRTSAKTLMVKMFGRGHIDNGNKLSILNVLSLVNPADCPVSIRHGYNIASIKHQAFLDCGFSRGGTKVPPYPLLSWNQMRRGSCDFVAYERFAFKGNRGF